MEASGYREDQPTSVAGAASVELDPTAIRARSPWQVFWRRLREDKLAFASLIFVAFLGLTALFAPLIVDIVGAPDPDARDTSALDPFFATPTGPSC